MQCDVLSSVLASGEVETPSGEKRPLHSGIRPEVGDFIQTTIRDLRPRRSIEIGCAYGVSSLYICSALSQVGAERHVVIDPGQSKLWEGIGLANIRRGGFGDLVTFYEEPSFLRLAVMTQANERYDLAFIDGAHTFEYVLTDFFLLDKILRVGGVMIFDDVWLPAVRKVVRYILTNHPYESIGPAAPPVPMRKRLATKLASFLTPISADIHWHDELLGIPKENHIGLRKTGETIYAKGARPWDFYRSF
jgi:predicted O-methyltransferase YrrM